MTHVAELGQTKVVFYTLPCVPAPARLDLQQFSLGYSTSSPTGCVSGTTDYLSFTAPVSREAEATNQFRPWSVWT